MNVSCRRIGGPRRSAVGNGRNRLTSSLTRTKGFSREGQCPWRIDGLRSEDAGVEVEVEVEVRTQAGEWVGDRALRRQATMNASKTVVLGMLAAASMGVMQASPSQVPFASLALAIPAVSAEALATAFRSAWAGLAAGCLHTLAGADHLAALTPLTIGQSHLRASMLGALWGFGHSTGQLMLGLAMVVRRGGFFFRLSGCPFICSSSSLAVSHTSVSALIQCSCSRIGLAKSCRPSPSGAVLSWA